jgi:hypothetical protein
MMVLMHCMIIRVVVGVTLGKLGPTSMLCFRSSWCWEGCHPGSPLFEQIWCVWDRDHAAVSMGCTCVTWGSVSFRVSDENGWWSVR